MTVPASQILITHCYIDPIYSGWVWSLGFLFKTQATCTVNSLLIVYHPLTL